MENQPGSTETLFMNDADSQPWMSNRLTNLTEQEAHACLQQLARVSLGDAGLLPEASDESDESEKGAQPSIKDAQGSMAGEMYRTLLEQLPVVSFMAQLGAEFHDIYISPQIEALLGYSQREWLENPVLWYERLHPEDQARWNLEFSRFLVLDEPFRSVYRFLARDGRVVWVRGDVKIARDAQGLPLYIQGIGYDVTELKQAEEALRRAHEQLELRVEERTAQLAGANAALREEVAERERAEATLRRQAEELRQRQAEIEAFNERLKRTMQETHHRVKNNMQLIAALTEMQNVEGATMVSADGLKRVSIQARILALIHDILTQHVRDDAQELELSAREVLEKLITLLKQLMGNRGIHAHIEDARLSTKQGTSLAIILHELIANALKYGMGDIEVRFMVHEDQAILEVADNGPGFPEDFNPQLSTSYGLELVEYISRSDLHAEVIYDSRPQGGARITVKMPLVTACIPV